MSNCSMALLDGDTCKAFFSDKLRDVDATPLTEASLDAEAAKFLIENLLPVREVAEKRIKDFEVTFLRLLADRESEFMQFG